MTHEHNMNEEDDVDLASDDRQGLKPGMYRHFKGGLYKVLYTARFSEDESLMVVYLNAKGEPWVRPLKMWNEVTDQWPDRVRRPRFIPVEKAEESIFGRFPCNVELKNEYLIPIIDQNDKILIPNCALAEPNLVSARRKNEQGLCAFHECNNKLSDPPSYGFFSVKICHECRKPMDRMADRITRK